MTIAPSTTDRSDDMARLKRLRDAFDAMRNEIGRVVIGQDQVVEELLIAMFARGHCILVGVPGLAKTLLVSTLSRILSLSFKRIQFTPDLMPADITGTEIIQEDPRALLYHSRDSMTEVVEDTPANRQKGWRRMVLFGLTFNPAGEGMFAELVFCNPII